MEEDAFFTIRKLYANKEGAEELCKHLERH
jgi:hypothetical protein